MDKVCCRCKEVKNIILFNKNRRMSDGHHYFCKACAKLESTLRKEYLRDHNIKWYKQKFSDPEAKKEKYAKVKVWINNNRDYYNLYFLKRRDKKRKLDSGYSYEDSVFTRDLFNNKCFKCGSTEKLTIDHHMPLSLNEGLSRSNAVILCKSCNCKKHKKLPQDFYTSKELYDLSLLGIVTKYHF